MPERFETMRSINGATLLFARSQRSNVQFIFCRPRYWLVATPPSAIPAVPGYDLFSVGAGYSEHCTHRIPYMVDVHLYDKK